MKKISGIIFLAGIMFISLDRICAQQIPDEINNMFFKILEDKSPEKAFNYLYDDNRALEHNKDIINANKTGFINLTKQFGDYFGFEQLNKEETGKSIAKYTFLLKYEKSPVKVAFTYYKPNDKWKVLEVFYSVQVEDRPGGMRQLPLKNQRPIGN